MHNEQSIRPTESELEILNILWEKGTATVREVHDRLALTKNAGYTTTLKLMQIMLEKEMVIRDVSNKTHVYSAKINQEKTQGQIVSRMIDTLFKGSAMRMVVQAIGNHNPSKEEVEMIKEYLERKIQNQ